MTDSEVIVSRAKHGSNVLTPPPETPLWKLYLEKYQDPIIKILLVAACVSLVLAFVDQEFVETIGIFIAIFLATTVGFAFERDAAKKFRILNQLDEDKAVKVIRNGQATTIPRRDVVVGDTVILEAGDEVPADGLLTESNGLQVDESSLTGEPITNKSVDGHQGEHTYPQNMVLRSSMVMDGRGVCLVTAVGDQTEIGHVARNSTEQTNIKTPLNIQLDRLAKLISKVGTGVSMAAFLLFLIHDILVDDAIWRSGDYLGMLHVVLNYFMMAVTLIVMAVPEGLPMAVTLALALNMRRMLKSNNLVRRLHACETMGAVTVICTDKTGTLTQNRMKVVEIGERGERREEKRGERKEERGDKRKSETRDLLYIAIAANTTAHLNDKGGGIGNPTEVALLQWMKSQGEDYLVHRQQARIVEQIPFSTERKYMQTTAVVDGKEYLFIKGAPEIILARCQMADEERKAVEEKLMEWQRKAMRTLAFAAVALLSPQDEKKERKDLCFQAVVGISDPLRDDVPQAVRQCRKAGIEVKIITGDTSATALEIARQIGIIEERGERREERDCRSNEERDCHISGAEFAALSDEEALRRAPYIRVMSRARPNDKLRLVQMLQRQGEVVAVTGDGTNDAPALHYAHVGLSLGTGTSVAKAASDITIIDDSFRSIASAVMWGRSLYQNIQRFLYFQLVVNVTALLLVLAGAFIETDLPLTVTQILWVNLIMDTFAAMALASLPPSREVMNKPPRRQDEFIITKPIRRAILMVGLTFFAVSFGLLVYLRHYDSDPGILLHDLSQFFTFFVMLQFWNLLNAKVLGSSHGLLHGLQRSQGLLLVMAFILLGQWFIVTFGGRMFRTHPLKPEEWLAIIAVTSLVLLFSPLLKQRATRTTSHQTYQS